MSERELLASYPQRVVNRSRVAPPKGRRTSSIIDKVDVHFKMLYRCNPAVAILSTTAAWKLRACAPREQMGHLLRRCPTTAAAGDPAEDVQTPDGWIHASRSQRLGSNFDCPLLPVISCSSDPLLAQVISAWSPVSHGLMPRFKQE